MTSLQSTMLSQWWSHKVLHDTFCPAYKHICTALDTKSPSLNSHLSEFYIPPTQTAIITFGHDRIAVALFHYYKYCKPSKWGDLINAVLTQKCAQKWDLCCHVEWWSHDPSHDRMTWWHHDEWVQHGLALTYINVNNHQLSSLLPLKPSSQVRHDYDTRLRQRISMLTFFDSSQSVVACCSQSQSSRLMTSVGASSHLVENVAAKTVWFCDRDHHHHHHIRFWYLRCCGCPGLRGRSTIEYYHNEWVLWDVHNMNCMKLEVKAAAWQVSIYMYVYLAQYQHRD